MMEKNSFVFYLSFDEALRELPEKSRLRLYDAITDYALRGKETEFTGIEKAVFSLIKPQLQANNQRYENGKKGGAPKGNQNAKKTTEKQPVVNLDMEEENNLKTTEKQANENENENVIYTPLFIPPQGEKTNAFADKFFDVYPRYAKDRAKMRKDVDFQKLLEEFEKSSYLRSLYTVKQINDNYALIIAGEFRDKEKQVDSVTAGRELMAERERWYSARREAAERKAEEIRKRFMQHDTFKGIETRLRELMPEMARLEVESDKGNLKAKQRLVKLTQEQGRLKQQRVAIIEANGMSEEDLLPKWSCRKCQDTGYTADGTLCRCYGG
jgi:hypothetical protein